MPVVTAKRKHSSIGWCLSIICAVLALCMGVGCRRQAVQDIMLEVPLWEHGSVKGITLDNIVNTFAEVEPISLKQAWLYELEPSFKPTEVKMAWQQEGLHVFARLEDSDICSSSTQYNQRLWELGDVLEAFLLCNGADAYHEFQVSPNNHVVQLRVDVNLTHTQRLQQLPKLFMPTQVVESKVWVEEDENLWYAWMLIPAAVIKPAGKFASGDVFNFSFCRIDSSADKKRTILSSSSNLRELNFHGREDWGTLRLSPNHKLEIH